MYNHIRGTVVHKSPSRAVLEAGGIGYELTIPLSSSGRVPPPGNEATVLVHLIVREDELRLIGFASEEERSLFRRLIDLSGVGPAMALQILSGMTPQEFLQAVERQDAGALKKIKGVGEKTAKRIILEMKGAKTILPRDDPGTAPSGAPGEAAQALVALGVSPNEAAQRVERALRDAPDATVEELIRAALR
ncbi:MAG: Holliday junction branch migration protein RuvA [Planctomycetota bacterium]|nr:Holliday junction branch migration protein RuvA [Planctomycetota bacterium]